MGTAPVGPERPRGAYTGGMRGHPAPRGCVGSGGTALWPGSVSPRSAFPEHGAAAIASSLGPGGSGGRCCAGGMAGLAVRDPAVDRSLRSVFGEGWWGWALGCPGSHGEV